MNKKIFNAVIISIISVFVFTIAITIGVLTSDYKTGAKAIDNKFQTILKKTEYAIARHGQPNSNFIAEFEKNIIGSKDYYCSINLKNGNDSIYHFQNTSKLFTITKSARITEGEHLDLTLTLVLYALPATLIYSRLIVTFIITLIATLASILCLVYLYTHKDKSELKKTSEKSEEKLILDDDDFNFDISLPGDTDFETTSDDSTEDQTEYSFYDDSSAQTETITDESALMAYDSDSLDESLSFDEPLSFAEPLMDSFDSSSENQSEDVVSKSAAESVDSTAEPVISVTTPAVSEATTVNSASSDSSQDDDSLFNTKTGFCNQSYLVTRLESELSRASSSELDLSLILIRIPDINFEEPYGVSICNKILDLFHYKDIIFEYKNDGIAIICNGSDIDKAMETAEIIHTEICSILNASGINTKPVIGIASRTLRFISGERLIVEAEQALLHAKDDPESPIIAFRVNPEKYRKFMASQN